jgi:hypothetical protein
VNEEPIGKSLSYGASPINGFDGIDTILFGHCQQLSEVLHSTICLAVAGNNAVGVEAELLRIALAKAQLSGLQATVSRGERINSFLHELISESANFGTTQGTRDKTISRLTGSRPK